MSVAGIAADMWLTSKYGDFTLMGAVGHTTRYYSPPLQSRLALEFIQNGALRPITLIG